MKSKKQIRHRNKSKKFRKMKGAGGRFSIPMTIPDNLTLTPQERQEALTMRAPTATDVAQQQRNTALLREAGAVLQEQEGLHELAKLGSVTTVSGSSISAGILSSVLAFSSITLLLLFSFVFGISGVFTSGISGASVLVFCLGVIIFADGE